MIPYRFEGGEPVFSAHAALLSGGAQTRTGRTVRVVSFVPGANQPLVVLDSETKDLEVYNLNGTYMRDGEQSRLDLFNTEEST